MSALDGISVAIGVLLGAAVVLVWWFACSTWDRAVKPRPVAAPDDRDLDANINANWRG